MKIKLALTMSAMAGLIVMNGFSFAAASGSAPEAAAQKGVVSVGNKICPVSGEKVDSMGGATYEYQGKVYNLCCPGCIASFKKDPGTYIKKVESELKGNLAQ